jgi:hypothetical protein
VNVARTARAKDCEVKPRPLDAKMDLGRPLDEAATEIETFVAEQHFVEFTGTAVDLERHSVQLFWHGPVAPELTALINRLAVKTKIEIHSALYSRATLLAEEFRLLRDKSAGRSVGTVAAWPDYGGLEVTVDPGTTHEIGSSVKTTIKEGMRMVPESCPTDCPGARWSDTTPYYGGDAIGLNTGPPRGICSTGFEAFRPSGNIAFLLTAAHCGLSAGWNTPQSSGATWVGNSGNCCNPPDAMGITKNTVVEARDYAPYIWVGPYNAPTAAGVITWTSNPVGAIRCVSGAFSGEVCNNKVVSPLVTYDYGDGLGLRGPGFWMDQQQGISSAGQGDSGGPVYSVAPVTGDVSAAGLVVATTRETQTTNCTGIPGDPSYRLCSPHQFVSDIGNILNSLGFGLVVTTPKLVKLQSNANGLYASTELNYGGADYAVLRARAAAVGPWEQYSLAPQSDGTYALKANANGLYVSAELSYSGSFYGEMRARSSVVGYWEKFWLNPLVGTTYALQWAANSQYVAAEIYNAEPYYAMLRARSSAVGPWEQWTISLP